MGKKVNPHSLRIGITRTWDSIWYAKRDYKKNLLQDIEVRQFLEKVCKEANVAKVEIQRSRGKVMVIIHCGKPGVIIGRSGETIEKLKGKLREKYGKDFDLSVQEIRKPDVNAQLIAISVADQVARRFPYRRVAKMAIDRAKEGGVKGIKILVAGRLNGVDIARKEFYTFGTVPLHTLRAKIDYATTRAETTYGTIGVKVWVYEGMVFKNKQLSV